MCNERRIIMRKMALVVIAFSMLYVLGVGSVTAQGKPIKIGFLSPLTGTAAEGGKDMVDGFMMALDEVGGKVAGRPINVIVEDSAGQPAVGLAKARKLVTNDEIHLLAGLMFGHVCGAVAPYMNEQKIPLLTLAASPDDLTQRKRLPYLIRTSFSGSQTSQPFGEWAYKNLGIRQIVTIGNDYVYGHEGVAGFHKTFEDAGGKVIQKIWSPMGALDLAPYITQIRKDADTVFAHYIGSFTLRFAKQFEEAGLKGKMKVLGGMLLTDESNLAFMGDEALGFITTSNWSGALDTPEARKFVQEYRKRYGKIPSLYSVNIYSTARWLFEGIKAVGGNVEDKEKLLMAIRQVKLPNEPRGPLELDNYNNVIQNVFVRKVERVRGELQNTVIATIPRVSQFWKYNPEEFLKQLPYSRDYPPCQYCQ